MTPFCKSELYLLNHYMTEKLWETHILPKALPSWCPNFVSELWWIFQSEDISFCSVEEIPKTVQVIYRLWITILSVMTISLNYAVCVFQCLHACVCSNVFKHVCALMSSYMCVLQCLLACVLQCLLACIYICV